MQIGERQDPLGVNIYTYMPDINAIRQSSNLYAYCGNNPLMFVDTTGEEWYHWAIVGGLVVGAAIATVATAGGAAPALIAVGQVASGMAAATTASTVAAGAFIGSSMVAGGALLAADISSVQNFNDSADWGTVAFTAGGAAIGGAYGYAISPKSTPQMINDGVCFIAETVVLTATGQVAIEAIEKGDFVYSENPETGEKGLKRVTQTFIRETDELIYISIDGQEITTTPEHPFYLLKEGWVAAKHLRDGDELLLQSGAIAVVEQVQEDVLDEPIMVYNFEVEDWHTYYVSDCGVLVHNSCSAPNNWGKGSFSTPERSQQYHFNEHGIEVGAKDFNDYLRKANAFKDVVMQKGIRGTYVGGRTPDVFRYTFNGKYIDLQSVAEGVKRIISFGKL